MKTFFTQKNKQKGFTLVETLVALSIFSVSILAMLVILAQGITNTAYAKKKMTATYLVQEGTEYIRNMRDTFMLYDPTSPQTGWGSFLIKVNPCDITSNSTKSCYFDDQNLSFTNQAQPMEGIAVNACSTTCPSLLYDSSNDKYGYAAGVDSGFIRKIQVNQISANELKVTSTVSWVQGSGTYQLTFSETLFNWIE